MQYLNPNKEDILQSNITNKWVKLDVRLIWILTFRKICILNLDFLNTNNYKDMDRMLKSNSILWINIDANWFEQFCYSKNVYLV